MALLLAYFEAQRKMLEGIYADLKDLPIKDEKDTVYAGYLLHNFYTGFEDLMEEVAKTFENAVDDPTRYHRELLKRMKLSVKGIRPALISEESFRFLDEIRAFRHIFRHAYGYALEKTKIEYLTAKLQAGVNTLRKDLETFQTFLENELQK